MKKYGRRDLNQQDIVFNLRKVPGVTVEDLASQGGGCPDIIVGYHDLNYLIELKNPDQPPNKRKLTPDEKKWHAKWAGQVDIALTFEDCLMIIGIEVYEPDDIPF